ncbi:helix-turn-helix transcriptional regulator [Acinetobacter sp. 194]|uniref:winged helix-turn-helix transcriptional regulator n=1 Tax=Acinetobacter shaoyimingii TaxID=2715164 RepID=UPI00140AA665|nr:helix-turn-helix domain-containing protein [Acinetobacter shaoyimingii]NHB56820.1 helix-turn-helix transcriptional regulator [Acinetobacter shaoyimingii]
MITEEQIINFEKDEFEKDACSIAFVMALKDALNVINGKWKLAIVCTLLAEQRRFNDIERLIKGITPRMISKELKELEINGVVRKIQLTENNLSITKYDLTESGKNLYEVIVKMVEWGKQHRALSLEQHQVNE